MTYGDGIFSNVAQDLRNQVDESYYFHYSMCYRKEDLSDFFYTHQQFYNDNPSNKGGIKCYQANIWKPYLIHRVLSEIKNNDILFYVDGGCSFVAKGKNKKRRQDRFNYYIDILRHSAKPILAFCPFTHVQGQPDYIQENCIKKYTLEYFNLNNEKFLNMPHLESGIVGIRKTPITMGIIKMWADLVIADDYKLITKNSYDKTENPKFMAHVRDQSILNILFYLFGLNRLDGYDLYGQGPFFAGRMTDEGQKQGYHDPHSVI